jgi:hypothetical protein
VCFSVEEGFALYVTPSKEAVRIPNPHKQWGIGKTQPEREAYNTFSYVTEVRLYLLPLWFGALVQGNFTFTLAEISRNCYVSHKALRKASAGNENRDGRSSLCLNYSVPRGIRFMKLRRTHDAVCYQASLIHVTYSGSVGHSVVRML